MGAVCSLELIGAEEGGSMKTPQSNVTRLDIPGPGVGTSATGAVAVGGASSTWLLGQPGLAGRVSLSWALAGGLTMEATLVLAAVLSGTRAATSDPFAATFFFVIGVVGGFVHGALVGVVGRPDDVPLARAIKSVERSAVVTVPLAALAWGAALWIALTPVEAARSRLDLIGAMGVGWLILMAALIWALREGRSALRHTLCRWPLGRWGAVSLGLMSVSLLVSFVWWRPEIWFTDVRTTPLGAAILAAGVTVWFGLPVLVLGLHCLRRRNEAGAPSTE